MIHSLSAFVATRERMLVATLLLLGAAERIAWCALRPTLGPTGEAFNVARALALGRGWADAYRPGQGATAHLLPFGPAMAGGVYAVLGVRMPAAEAVLASGAIALALASYWLFFRAFRRLGLSLPLALGALAYGCLAPAYVAQEAVDFRVWEGGLAVMLAALFLDRLLASPVHPSAGQAAGLGALAAVAFFVNPAVGLGVVAAGAALAWQRWSPGFTALAAAAAAAMLALLAGTWAWRNDRVLGAPIPLRSNGGLELALANYPGALAARDPLAAMRARLMAIHPMPSDSAYRAMRDAGGEVRYARLLGDGAERWMISDPAAVAQLAARHLWQTFAPPPWSFHLFGAGTANVLRSLLASIAGLAGLVGALWHLGRPRNAWLCPALMVLVPALAFCVFQPVSRYTYLIYIPCIFLGADAVGRLAGVAARFSRARPAAAASHDA